MKRRFICLVLAACTLIMILCGCGESDTASGSDAPDAVEIPVVWEQAADDEAYMDMMRAKLYEYINCMTALSSMEKRLIALDDAEKIADDEEFSALVEQLYDWCEGAHSYSADTLSDEQAITVCQQIRELAGATSAYLENLPAMLAGTYSGELSAADYQNSIVDNALAIYELLEQ